jgi:hypothetical protein
MPACKIDEKLVEILRVSLDLGKARFYSIYKKTRMPLATAWRKVKQAVALGLLRADCGFYEVTERGLIAMASLGDPAALALLARMYGSSEAAVMLYLERACEKFADILSLPVSSLADTIRLFNVPELRQFKGTPAEPLAARLFLSYCSACAVNIDGNMHVFGHGNVIAARCNLCGGERYELFPDCGRLAEIFSKLERVFIKRPR